ncbi:DUF551 domain-containing protein [Kiloniella sp.]|uniref:DUF551 domain-containing protein n=1 Tax=Kiloniella sp. TaxID=1938587 RepID=UPI003B029FD5
MSQDKVIRRLINALQPFAERRETITDYVCHSGLTSVDKCCRCSRAIEATAAIEEAEQLPPSFQAGVDSWMEACFGSEISKDRIERNHRFLEEALELVQSTGCTSSEAHQLVDYVFNRPVGELSQEVGGVIVTLAALCSANDTNLEQNGWTELERIWEKKNQIRAKQAAKPKHSPLPEDPFENSEEFVDEYKCMISPKDDEELREIGELRENKKLQNLQAQQNDLLKALQKISLVELNADELAKALFRCGDIANEALSQSDQGMEPSPWQPIETAPKDGTHVLVMTDKGYFAVAYPYQRKGSRCYNWDAVGQDRDSYTDGNCLDGEPTHWMPLPPAPEG